MTYVLMYDVSYYCIFLSMLYHSSRSSPKCLSWSLNVWTFAYEHIYICVSIPSQSSSIAWWIHICPTSGLKHRHHYHSLSIYLLFLCFFCWNFLKWVWMVAAAFSTSTGLSGGTAGMAHVPLLALDSEHDRTQGTAREAEAIAMET